MIRLRLKKVSVLLVVITAMLTMTLPARAHEHDMCAMPEYVVTRTDDPSGGFCTPASCSLRQAVAASNGCSGTQTIRIPSGTYVLTLPGAYEEANLTGDLDILDSVNIVGEGMPVIDGNHSGRIFDIKAGARVTMTGLAIQNGRDSGGGEGILNWGNLIATELLIQNNINTSGVAAGVINKGVAFFSRSAVVHNTARDPDGAISAGGLYSDGRLILDNVTVSDNEGCGVMNGGTADIMFSTIADNLANCEIWNSSTLVISNSIVGTRPGFDNCRGFLTSDGFNIDSGGFSSCGFVRPTDLVAINPGLFPLFSFGGRPPVRPIAPDSMALDTADPLRCGGTDQRGVTRPQGRACDRGAFERDVEAGMHLEAGTPTETVPLLPVIESQTVTPRPTSTEDIIDFDKDGNPADKDCNDDDPKIFPGAPETPDDKVDSNCNSADDT